MRPAAVDPGLRAGDRHVLRIGDAVGKVEPILLGGVASNRRLGHGVNVLVAVLVILLQVGIGVGAAIPDGRDVHALSLAVGRAGQSQDDLVGVVVFLVAVDPGLGAADGHIFGISDRVGEVVAILNRSIVAVDLDFGDGVGILVAVVVILVQAGIGVGVPVPGRGGFNGLRLAVGGAGQGQGDLSGVVVGSAAVDPGLGAGNFNVLGISDRILDDNGVSVNGIAGLLVIRDSDFLPAVFDFNAVVILGQVIDGGSPVVVLIQHHGRAVGQRHSDFLRTGFTAVFAVHPFLLDGTADGLGNMAVRENGNVGDLFGLDQLILFRYDFRPGILDQFAVGILGQIINGG